ncbi:MULTISPECIES: ATP-binding cassette domain-containing protein [Stenotrophomonas maltophilia group]|uniref:ATP-binding cassette domain-containing protein n=1 Tax=Stenotrophomonas maltophilia group TaxID=995085 RepID=UPI0015F5993C|nr:ATP-binding cassette domain-containing protein [Stenotrophomonas maltophilia]EKU9958596.1 ATP-binding cassette domain-containing protein [Stenotrophomonas maltophilia]EKU9961585.1 ATP-binding cassette domain-containing protein [Stenotrophomonas maltophilia]EKU9984063.1 ATP-binding cassette domain-containing protein [Stenotrophomonas maltophilia]EKU9987829.1 ATP-binding cassette domain-containing protein [Stenotrophomonas maltophilia]HEO8484748.1 ATP-binding cassette domain-containing protei
MSTPAVIALEDVQFGYATRLVLDIPQLLIEQGSSVLLRGVSGGGKSTLLGLLAGVLLPGRGRVEVAGHALQMMRGAARDRFRADHLGVIFQQFNLLPFLSVRDNIALGLRFSPVRSERISGPLDDEILRLLEALQLDPALSKRAAGTLSVGQQQRVAAARALIGRPAVLLADEPTSALDRLAATAFLQLMSAQCRAAGTTVLVVSHDDSLQPLFDRTISLSEINHAGGTHA